MTDHAEALAKALAERDALHAGLSDLVNCQSALPRAAMREAAATILRNAGLKTIKQGGDRSPLVAALAAYRSEPVAWEATTVAYKQFVTDAQYQKFSAEARRWYKPYRCSNCTPALAGTEPAGEVVEPLKWAAERIQSADRKLATIDFSASTGEDIAAGRVAAYQGGFQIGVKSALTDLSFVLAALRDQPEA